MDVRLPPQAYLIGTYDDPADVQAVLSRYPAAAGCQREGIPQLIFAVWARNLPVVRVLLAGGADKDARDFTGTTALSAAYSGPFADAAIYEELLAWYADPCAGGSRSALAKAIRHGAVLDAVTMVTRTISERKLREPSIRLDDELISPLAYAVRWGDPEMIAALESLAQKWEIVPAADPASTIAG